MTILDYPDPVDVAVEVMFRRGQYAWGLVTDTDVKAAGVLPFDAGRVDAQLAVLKVLLEHPQLAGAPVNLMCADEDMHRALSELRHLIPNVDPRPYSDRLKTHPRIRAARAVAHVALDQVQPKTEPDRIVAATDGSFRRHGNLAGWGWVTDQGRYGFGHLEAHDVLVAELAAIRALLESTPRHIPLLVLVDSQPALGLVEVARGAAARGVLSVRPTGSRRADAQVAAIAELLMVDRVVEFTWVRGHSGDPLNEGADRLAVHARRTASAGVEREVAVGVAENIVAETQQALLSVAVAAHQPAAAA